MTLRVTVRGGENSSEELDPKRLVFIDKTWAKTNMTRTRGWSKRGPRLIAKASGFWKTTTFLAAPRRDEVTAPLVLDGPINGDSFLAYVEQILAPTLKPGNIVVMDNLGSHKSEAVAKAIEPKARGASSCPNTRPTLIRSSKSSPSSNARCARPKNEPSTRCGEGSEFSSTSFHQLNAPLISGVHDMPQPKSEKL